MEYIEIEFTKDGLDYYCSFYCTYDMIGYEQDETRNQHDTIVQAELDEISPEDFDCSYQNKDGFSISVPFDEISLYIKENESEQINEILNNI